MKDKISSDVFFVDDSDECLELRCRRSDFCMKVARNQKGYYDIDLYLTHKGKMIEYDPGSLRDIDLRTPRYRKALVQRVKDAASAILRNVGRYQQEELDRILKLYAGAAHQVEFGPVKATQHSLDYRSGSSENDGCTDCKTCKCGK